LIHSTVADRLSYFSPCFSVRDFNKATANFVRLQKATTGLADCYQDFLDDLGLFGAVCGAVVASEILNYQSLKHLVPAITPISSPTS
jgi:surfactin synthase thioesterase subunit